MGEVSLQVYVDKKQCCKDTKDALTCLRDGCDVQPVNKHWGKRPLSYKMMITGNVFEFSLDEFLLEGTKYTSPTKTNVLEIGKDVNSGDVTNALDEVTAQVDEGDLKGNGPSEADFAAFKKEAEGTCLAMDAEALFAKVVWKAGTFRFNCVETHALCKCISATGLSKRTVTFEGQKHTLQLFGKGNTLEYSVTDRKTGKRRRKIL